MHGNRPRHRSRHGRRPSMKKIRHKKVCVFSQTGDDRVFENEFNIGDYCGKGCVGELYRCTNKKLNKELIVEKICKSKLFTLTHPLTLNF